MDSLTGLCDWCACNEEVTAEKLKDLVKAGISNISLYIIPLQEEADIIRNTLRKDKTRTEEEAQARIYAKSVRASRAVLKRPGTSSAASSSIPSDTTWPVSAGTS